MQKKEPQVITISIPDLVADGHRANQWLNKLIAKAIEEDGIDEQLLMVCLVLAARHLALRHPPPFRESVLELMASKLLGTL